MTIARDTSDGNKMFFSDSKCVNNHSRSGDSLHCNKLFAICIQTITALHELAPQAWQPSGSYLATPQTHWSPGPVPLWPHPPERIQAMSRLLNKNKTPRLTLRTIKSAASL